MFRSEEVFADDRLTVELHKPCPHCGDEATLRLSRFNEPQQMLLSGEPGINVPWILAHLGLPRDGDDDVELTAMFEADQSSRRERTMSAADDRARLVHVLSMLERDELCTPADYRHAAMILQHGDAREHYHLAFELARPRLQWATSRPGGWRPRHSTAGS